MTGMARTLFPGPSWRRRPSGRAGSAPGRGSTGCLARVGLAGELVALVGGLGAHGDRRPHLPPGRAGLRGLTSELIAAAAGGLELKLGLPGTVQQRTNLRGKQTPRTSHPTHLIKHA